jgi:hypothetical protein
MEQDLTVGTRVKHAQYGEGVIVDSRDDSLLVQFDAVHAELHSALTWGNQYPLSRMYQYIKGSSRITAIQEPTELDTPVALTIEEDISNQKRASQALVDILLKLSYRVLPEMYYKHYYETDKMEVFWDDGDCVLVTYSSKYLSKHPDKYMHFADIDGEPIEVVTAYFQKKLDKKLNKKLNKKQKKATNKQTPEQQEYELLLAELKEMVAPFYTDNHKDTAKIGKMSFHFNRDNEGLYEEGTTTLYIEGNGNSISITNIREYLYVFVAHGSSYAGYNYHNLPLGTIDVISTIKQWIKLVSETTSYMEFYHREDTNTWTTASVPLIEFHHDKMGALLVALQENNIQCSGGEIFEGMDGLTRNSFTINMCSSQQATIKGKQDEYSTVLGVIKSCT